MKGERRRNFGHHEGGVGEQRQPDRAAFGLVRYGKFVAVAHGKQA